MRGCWSRWHPAGACALSVIPRPEDGMFSSICAGLQAVLEQARADGVEPEQGGVFVHPVDVPLTRRLTLLALLRTADAVPGDSPAGGVLWRAGASRLSAPFPRARHPCP